MNIYLDNAATTKLSDDHINYLSKVMKDCYGNPNSHHSVGDKARVLVEKTRNLVADFIGADSEEIIFTPSGSAANNLGILGYINNHPSDVIYTLFSPIAHKSIIKCCENIKFSIPLFVDANGMITLESLELIIKIANKIGHKCFVVIDYANSEIGTIQDVKKIIDIAHKYGCLVYLDCTASLPSIKMDVKELDVDMIGFSGHKLGALKGIGVLYKKKEIGLSPLIYGAQEFGLVGGTLNVLAIASLGYALTNYNYPVHQSSSKRDYLLHNITKTIDRCMLVGSIDDRLSNNLNMMFKGIESSRLIQMLDNCGIQVSSGSACNSGTPLPSYVLKAIGLSDDDARCCIRISLSGEETYEELDYVVNMLKSCIDVIRNGVLYE